MVAIRNFAFLSFLLAGMMPAMANLYHEVPAMDLGQPEAMVQKMYIAYYGRPGDLEGVNYWTDRLQASGGNLEEIIDAFGNSPEYTERFGNLSDEELVQGMYQRLFDRDADSEGLAYYLDLLCGCNRTGFNPGRRQASLARIALDILNGAQNEDATMVENQTIVAVIATESMERYGLPYGIQDIPSFEAILEESRGRLLSGLQNLQEWLWSQGADIALGEAHENLMLNFAKRGFQLLQVANGWGFDSGAMVGCQQGEVREVTWLSDETTWDMGIAQWSPLSGGSIAILSPLPASSQGYWAFRAQYPGDTTWEMGYLIPSSFSPHPVLGGGEGWQQLANADGSPSDTAWGGGLLSPELTLEDNGDVVLRVNSTLLRPFGTPYATIDEIESCEWNSNPTGWSSDTRPSAEVTMVADSGIEVRFSSSDVPRSERSQITCVVGGIAYWLWVDVVSFGEGIAEGSDSTFIVLP